MQIQEKSAFIQSFPFLYFNSSNFYRHFRASILLPFLLSGLFASAQNAYTSTVNIAGLSATVGDYHLDWSVGESSAITSMFNGDLLLTNGLLQYSVENQPEANLVPNFLPGEIIIYPNPVKNLLNINILHANKGKHQLELLDVLGAKIKEVQLVYNGLGALQKWNMSGLPAGQYILNIRQTNPVTGRLMKKKAFKILKIN
jgi:hypothetical protein